MTTPDPLLERLRQLPRAALDDVAAARTLARTEAAFVTPPAAKARAMLPRWSVPTALAMWGLFYAWGAVGALARLFPADAAKPAVAESTNHRGPGINSQFMLNAINNASARTTTTMTIAPPLPDTFCATSRSIVVPCSDVSSDMDPSMQVVACETRLPNGATFGAGRGTFAARTAARSARMRRSLRAFSPTGSASRRDGA
jgi:hypothetical protein